MRLVLGAEVVDIVFDFLGLKLGFLFPRFTGRKSEIGQGLRFCCGSSCGLSSLWRRESCNGVRPGEDGRGRHL